MTNPAMIEPINMGKVQYRLAAYQVDTNNPISSIKVGQNFDIAMLVKDLRPDGTFIDKFSGIEKTYQRGVFAAYADILYDKTLATVSVAEVQQVAFDASLPTKGKFFLVATGRDLAPKRTDYISYDHTDFNTRIQTMYAIEKALNAVLGPGSVKVMLGSVTNSYKVKFVGFYRIDERPLMTSNPFKITVTEVLKGGSVSPTNNVGVLAGVIFNGAYNNVVHGDDAPDRLDNIGGVLSSQYWYTGIGTDEVEVLRIRLGGKKAGTANFTLNFDDVPHPAFYTLVLANITCDPPEQSEVENNEIVSINTSIKIV